MNLMVYTLGESLLDIIISGHEQIVAKAGGSMLNTAVSLGRCGISTSMISETGDDMTAKMILEFLVKNNVKINLIKKYYHQKTSVALAFLDENKKPEYSIHKSYPETRLIPSPAEFDEDDILAFGSVYSLDQSIRGDIVNMLARAKNKGCILLYDPNIRTHQLEKQKIESAVFENFAFANIIKASDEDLSSIFGKLSVEEYYSKLSSISPDSIIIITLGSQGAVAFKNNIRVKIPAFTVEVVSTVGAGDSFSASIIYYLKTNKINRKKLLQINEAALKKMIETGVYFSAEVCSRMDNYLPEGFIKK